MQRRMIRVPLHVQQLAHMMMGGGTYKIGEEIPKDAQFIGAVHDPNSNSLVLFFSHESFPLCEDGARPDLQIVTVSDVSELMRGQ